VPSRLVRARCMIAWQAGAALASGTSVIAASIHPMIRASRVAVGVAASISFASSPPISILTVAWSRSSSTRHGAAPDALDERMAKLTGEPSPVPPRAVRGRSWRSGSASPAIRACLPQLPVGANEGHGLRRGLHRPARPLAAARALAPDTARPGRAHLPGGLHHRIAQRALLGASADSAACQAACDAASASAASARSRRTCERPSAVTAIRQARSSRTAPARTRAARGGRGPRSTRSPPATAAGAAAVDRDGRHRVGPDLRAVLADQRRDARDLAPRLDVHDARRMLMPVKMPRRLVPAASRPRSNTVLFGSRSSSCARRESRRTRPARPRRGRRRSRGPHRRPRRSRA